MKWVRWFGEIGIADVPLVGGKNASLGEVLHELEPLGIHVHDSYEVALDQVDLIARLSIEEVKIP